MTLGPLFIEAFHLRRKVWRVWLPDGLHIWWLDRGVHVYWSAKPHVQRERGEWGAE